MAEAVIPDVIEFGSAPPRIGTESKFKNLARTLAELVEKAYLLGELSEQLRADTMLRGLQLHLRVEGAKVLASNERLVAQLRRILDIRQSAERKEVGRLLQEIKVSRSADNAWNAEIPDLLWVVMLR